MLLEKGHVVAEGEPAEVVAIHQEHSERESAAKAARSERGRSPLSAAAALPVLGRSSL